MSLALLFAVIITVSILQRAFRAMIYLPNIVVPVALSHVATVSSTAPSTD